MRSTTINWTRIVVLLTSITLLGLSTLFTSRGTAATPLQNTVVHVQQTATSIAQTIIAPSPG